MDRSKLLPSLPSGLREPLFQEFDSLMANYLEGRWTPSELSAGKFCEIVFTIIDGYSKGSYAQAPSKPRDMVTACRSLENVTSLPRSLQILIPRMLPPLYEIRNNRGVGHVSGEINSNAMDSSVAVSMTRWIMAELIRVFHALPTEAAQRIVDGLAQIALPIVWCNTDMRRVLDAKMPLKDQILTLLVSNGYQASSTELQTWTEQSDRAYFLKSLRQLHKSRMIEFDEQRQKVLLLPPGGVQAGKIAIKYNNPK